MTVSPTPWIEFLSQIEAGRRKIGCTASAAWFRGHGDSEWQLVPSIFRFPNQLDPDDVPNVRKRETKIQILKSRRETALAEKTRLKRSINTSHFSSGATVDTSGYHEAKDRVDKLKSEIAAAETELARFKAPAPAERDLFDEYSFRSGHSSVDSSWQILAEMRHHAIPTRLLDWSDRLDVALYFALEEFRALFAGHHLKGLDLDKALAALHPCIWILNPYKLANQASHRRSIIDVSRDSALDYYDRLLIGRDWPYDLPLPIYPPSRFERVQAQRGYFTVFGNSIQGMSDQLPIATNCLQRIDISRKAAEYYVRNLQKIHGFGRFELFRDLDSLGSELSLKYAELRRSGRHLT